MRSTSCVVSLLSSGNAADPHPGPHHPVGKPSGLSPSVLQQNQLPPTKVTLNKTHCTHPVSIRRRSPYSATQRWLARRREGFPSRVKHCPKSVARTAYLPVTATLRASVIPRVLIGSCANIAGTFGGRALTIVSRPFQGYQRITLSLRVPNPIALSLFRMDESWRQLAKGRSETLWT
jgi:hypothetical protein